MSDVNYSNLLNNLKKAKSDYEKKQEKIRLENEKLKAEKEKADKENAEKIRIEKEKAEKLQKELNDKKEAERLENERKNAEIEKQKKAAEKLAKAPVKKQLDNWVNLFQSPLSPMEHEKVDLILEKFEAFKIWAKSEIEKL